MDSLKSEFPRENIWIWGVKIITGLFIVVLLGIHFAVNHLLAPDGLLSYADILAYYQKPVVPIMEIFLLGFVVVHALIGLRSILLDLHLPEKIARYLDVFFVTIGTIMIVYGTWLVIKVVQLGSA